MAPTLYAQPYDIAARGFFFESAVTYACEVATKTNNYGIPVEKFEIQFIKGELIDAQLFVAWEVGQADIQRFFEVVEAWDDDQKARVIIALTEGVADFDPYTDDPDDLDIDLYTIDTMEDLAEQFVEDGLFGDIPEHLAWYIDYAAIARDLAMDYTAACIAGQRLIYRAA